MACYYFMIAYDRYSIYYIIIMTTIFFNKNLLMSAFDIGLEIVAFGIFFGRGGEDLSTFPSQNKIKTG